MWDCQWANFVLLLTELSASNSVVVAYYHFMFLICFSSLYYFCQKIGLGISVKKMLYHEGARISHLRMHFAHD